MPTLPFPQQVVQTQLTVGLSYPIYSYGDIILVSGTASDTSSPVIIRIVNQDGNMVSVNDIDSDIPITVLFPATSVSDNVSEISCVYVLRYVAPL